MSTFPVHFKTFAKMCIIINSTFVNGLNAENDIYLQLEKWHTHIIVDIIIIHNVIHQCLSYNDTIIHLIDIQLITNNNPRRPWSLFSWSANVLDWKRLNWCITSGAWAYGEVAWGGVFSTRNHNVPLQVPHFRYRCPQGAPRRCRQRSCPPFQPRNA